MRHDSSELRQVRKEATVARENGCRRVPSLLFLLPPSLIIDSVIRVGESMRPISSWTQLARESSKK